MLDIVYSVEYLTEPLRLSIVTSDGGFRQHRRRPYEDTSYSYYDDQAPIEDSEEVKVKYNVYEMQYIARFMKSWNN